MARICALSRKPGDERDGSGAEQRRRHGDAETHQFDGPAVSWLMTDMWQLTLTRRIRRTHPKLIIAN